MIRPHPAPLEAVLYEEALDPGTSLLLVRPDATETACRELERRVFALRLSGRTTFILDLAGPERASGAMIAMLLRVQRKIGVRNGRLLVGTDNAEVGHVVAYAGLELLDVAVDAAVTASATGAAP